MKCESLCLDPMILLVINHEAIIFFISLSSSDPLTTLYQSNRSQGNKLSIFVDSSLLNVLDAGPEGDSGSTLLYESLII